jgi:hypothetical protein
METKMEVLFQKSFHQVWQQMLAQAAQDVQKLDRKLFSDPALAGHLVKIAAKYGVEVAQLDGEATAKRRSEEKERDDGWGGRHRVTITWLDVSIPFVGEAETFRVAPSSWSSPNNEVVIGANKLTISVIDDDRAETVVENFKKTVGGNLQTLRSEYERVKPELEQRIQQAANDRKAQIDAEDARDKARSFRVVN